MIGVLTFELQYCFISPCVIVNAPQHFCCLWVAEPGVRVELMEQVPHVAVYCFEHHAMVDAISQDILNIVLHFLTDPNNQVSLSGVAKLFRLHAEHR